MLHAYSQLLYQLSYAGIWFLLTFVSGNILQVFLFVFNLRSPYTAVVYPNYVRLKEKLLKLTPIDLDILKKLYPKDVKR